MAVFKANYTRVAKEAKASVYYIETRRGLDGEKINRTLFNDYGPLSRKEAYSLFNEADKGSVFFRFIVSPDPKLEDTGRDLDLREIVHKTMLALEDRMLKSVQWVAAVHADHAPHRHVHIVAVLPKGAKLYQEDLENLRLKATALSLEQRRELDLALSIRAKERGRTSTAKRPVTTLKRLPQRLTAIRQSRPQAVSAGRKAGGGPVPRPQICFCPRCGNREPSPHIEHGIHSCSHCGRQLHQGKKISLNLNKERQAVWDAG